MRFLDALRVPVLAFGLLASGCCSCGEKSDEEKLKERIDTTSVHLYVATKIAVTKSDSSPEAAEARKQLGKVMELVAKAHAAAAAVDAPAGEPTRPAAASAAPELSPGDFLALAKALYLLREQGAEIVRSGKEDALPPVLPVLMGKDLPPELAPVLDTNTEHALFLTALFGLRFHPRSPAPVPDELLLYEAWSTKTKEVKLEGLTFAIGAIKAVTYGNAELCDLAAGEAKIVAEAPREPEKTRASLAKLSSGGSDVNAEEAKTLHATFRALAHGVSAKCYFGRDQRPEGMKELQSFLDAAEETGLPPGETAIVRAFVAYENGDKAGARKALEQARDLPTTDAETRGEIDRLLGDIEEESAFRAVLTKPLLMSLMVKIVFVGLERSGVLDELSGSPVGRALHGFTYATTRTLSSGREAIPGWGDVKGVGSSWLSR